MTNTINLLVVFAAIVSIGVVLAASTAASSSSTTAKNVYSNSTKSHNGTGKNSQANNRNGSVVPNANATKTEMAGPKSNLKIGQCDKSIKNIANINSIEIKDCKGTACTFKRGEKYYIRVNFTPLQRCTSISLNISGIIAKRAVPFPVEDRSLCQKCIHGMQNTTKCMIKKSVPHQFEYSMEVLKTFPAISLPVCFQLKCEDKSVFCFMFPIKLV